MATTTPSDRVNKITRAVLDIARNKVPVMVRRENITLHESDMNQIENEIRNLVENNANSIRSLSREEIQNDLITHSVEELITRAIQVAKEGKGKNQLANDIIDAYNWLSTDCKGIFPFWNEKIV